MPVLITIKWNFKGINIPDSNLLFCYDVLQIQEHYTMAFVNSWCRYYWQSTCFLGMFGGYLQ